MVIVSFSVPSVIRDFCQSLGSVVFLSFLDTGVTVTPVPGIPNPRMRGGQTLCSGQVSQEAGQVVWYSHLFKSFPQCIVIHTVKGFGIVNKAEIDVFLELSCFFHDPVDAGNLISGSSAFLKPV